MMTGIVYRKWIGCFFLSISLVSFFFASFSAQAGGYTKTRNPVVLVHGFLGFDTALKVDYWYGIARHLRRGGTRVFTSDQSSVNGSEVRGEQLIRYLSDLKAIYGFRKFNLIGHSQGGFDVRYVASTRPDLVASVTTVGSPATGSGLAGFLDSTTQNNPAWLSFVLAGKNLLGSIIEIISNDTDPIDSQKTMETVSYVGAAKFNLRHPQAMPKTRCGQGSGKVNGIYYYSMSGTRTLTNIFDPSDYVLSIGATFDNERSDGLAGRCATHLGKVLRDDYRWNHLDQINHVFGLRGWFSANPLSVYRSHVNRLKLKGL